MSVATPAESFLKSPLGGSLAATEVREQLAQMPDWESRYQAVIDLGRKVPPLAEADRIEAHHLHGCDAIVWVVHHFDPASGKLYFLSDSDSVIVRGLLACLLCLYSGKTPEQILAYDAKPWMREVGLVQHLANTRSNGVWAMIGKMKAVASRY